MPNQPIDRDRDVAKLLTLIFFTPTPAEQIELHLPKEISRLGIVSRKEELKRDCESIC